MPRNRPLRADVCALTFLLVLPSIALASPPDALPGFGSMIARALASLGGVLGLIVLLAWLFRRLRATTMAGGGGEAVTSSGRLDLGARREIRVVKVRDRTLVVGVTEDRIELLTELDEPLSGDETEAANEAPAAFRGLRALQKLASSS